jgi:hypothetical protein
MRTHDIEAAVSALGLAGAVDSSWNEGVEVAYSKGIFVTPPLGDWILAVGQAMFCEGNAPKESVAPILIKLSKAFGEAQYFATHRVVEAHCWALARAGKLIRGYCYVGDHCENTWNEGEPTKAELALGKRTLESGPNESQPMAVAGAWSVNPSELESNFTQPGIGRRGRMPRRE